MMIINVFVFSVWQDGRAGRSALQLSIESRRQQIARILLVSCGACAHSCNYAGQNSRKLATEAGWHELARLMENQLSREGFRCCGDATSPEISPTRCSESGDPSDCELDSDSDSWKSGETRFYDSVDDRSTLIFKPLSSTWYSWLSIYNWLGIILLLLLFLLRWSIAVGFMILKFILMFPIENTKWIQKHICRPLFPN